MTVTAPMIVFYAVAGVVVAQPSFEVASVKAAPEVTDGSVAMNCTGGPGSANPSRLTCSHAALALLVTRAYDIPFYQLKAPEWMLWGGSRGGYDVVAKIPEGTTRDQFKLMLQGLLIERFHLAVHHEMRDYPQYSLVPGKGRSKLTRSPEGLSDARPMVTDFIDSQMRLTARHSSMRNLANFLSTQMASPVVDHTGIDGEYDFILEFAPDPRWRGILESRSATDYTKDAQNLFSALQDQLGLKLETTKAPLAFMVVDHAEKTPTEN
jgi:uncharacterized protein (TIGR03435 family)